MDEPGIKFAGVYPPKTWLWWLPGTTLRDPYAHWARRRGDEDDARGQPVMWEVGHPSTKRRRCMAYRWVRVYVNGAWVAVFPRRRASRVD